MKKSLTFSFAMLLGVAVLLSPVSNALEADMKEPRSHWKHQIFIIWKAMGIKS